MVEHVLSRGHMREHCSFWGRGAIQKGQNIENVEGVGVLEEPSDEVL